MYVIFIYIKIRKNIEESFRDLKNPRYGLGLHHCRSYQVDRLNVTLLIAALSIFALWLIGVAARLQELHYSFQTNTVRNKTVLSDMFIGLQVILRGEIVFNKGVILAVLNHVTNETIWKSQS